MTLEATTDAGRGSEARREALVSRLFNATIGFLDLYSVYLGDKLGLYEALREGSANSTELAARTGLDERYAREWLEQQAATAILDVDDSAALATLRRYSLPAGHDDVLVNPDSLAYLTGLVRLAVGAVSPLSSLLEAYRSGAGVAYADYGADTREGIALMNRPMFTNLLGTDWLPSIPDVHARLQADPPARVADIGCGVGWSSIAIARAYPKVRVDGLDLDEASVDAARANAAATGLDPRLRFDVRDAADPALAGAYDLVTAFETVHDMARPVEALRTMRALLAPGGSVLIADEAVAEEFSAPAGEIDRFNYGWSILHCLPAARTEAGSAATGTVMRPSTLRAYAEAAGFTRFEVLPIENDFWRFYRLRP